MSKDDEIKKDEFSYMMLGRLKSDVDTFLNSEYPNEKHLWALNKVDQIAEMKKLYNKIIHKPEWLSMDEIEKYEKQLGEIK